MRHKHFYASEVDLHPDTLVVPTEASAKVEVSNLRETIECQMEIQGMCRYTRVCFVEFHSQNKEHYTDRK